MIFCEWLFGSGIEDFEPTGAGYDSDGAAPWNWNLKADLFAEDMEWEELLEALRAYDPEF